MRGAGWRETVRPGRAKLCNMLHTETLICNGLALAWSEHLAIFLAWLAQRR